jgi:hypothetical protein
MAKKAKLKTQKNNSSVTAFVNNLKDEQIRKDCKTLVRLFKSATGMRPKMWGTSIVGFGEHTYYRSNGDEGKFLATGFSPRKSGPTVYIMPGYSKYQAFLKKIGPHKTGSSCLYFKNLNEVNLKVLEALILRGFKDLKLSSQK